MIKNPSEEDKLLEFYNLSNDLNRSLEEDEINYCDINEILNKLSKFLLFPKNEREIIKWKYFTLILYNNGILRLLSKTSVENQIMLKSSLITLLNQLKISNNVYNEEIKTLTEIYTDLLSDKNSYQQKVLTFPSNNFSKIKKSQSICENNKLNFFESMGINKSANKKEPSKENEIDMEFNNILSNVLKTSQNTNNIYNIENKTQEKTEQILSNIKPEPKLPFYSNVVNNSKNFDLQKKNYDNINIKKELKNFNQPHLLNNIEKEIKNPPRKEPVNFVIPNNNNLRKNHLINNAKSKPKSRSKSKASIEKVIDKSKKKLSDFISKVNIYNTPIQFLKKCLEMDDLKLQKYEKLLGYQQEISQECKTTILYLICLFFPTYSNSQKKELIGELKQLNLESKVNQYKHSLLYVPKTDRHKELISSLILSKDIKETINLHRLTIENINEFYQLYLFYKITGDKTNTSNQVIIYKIIISLIILIKNYHIIPSFRDSLELFKDLFTIQSFYKNLKNKVDNVTIFNWYNRSNSFDCFSDNNWTFAELFEPEDIEIYQKVINNIGRLYDVTPKNEILLINSKENLKFLSSIIDLFFFKQQKIINSKSHYRKTLIKLEREIVSFSKMYFDKEGNIFDKFTIDSEIKQIFDSLYSLLKTEFRDIDFSLYPFGSITQFLSSKSSDLDIYLDISRVHNKIDFVEKLLRYVQKNLDKYGSITVSFRLCVISFKYKTFKIDLSCLGFCPYMHSNLLRTYSMIDSRFTILALCIKEIIGLIKIKNVEGDKGYLNSFCWMMLLIVFLQDVINPPILPKLLSESKTTKKEVEFGGKKKNFKNSNYKNLNFFWRNTYTSYIYVPYDNYKNYKDIYSSNCKEKNKMSVSEILLQFLEFVGYYFKYDSIFVNCYFLNEGLDNLASIYRNRSQDETLFKYYNDRYFQKNKNTKIYEKDGCVLFREPFDGNYNPGQSLKSNEDIFISSIQEAYKLLVSEGSISKLKTI